LERVYDGRDSTSGGLVLYALALAAHHVAIGFAWVSNRIGDSAKWVLED
jgi:hypothetical protein